VRGHSSAAPFVYAATHDNEVTMYDLGEFRTRQLFRAWVPRDRAAKPQRADARRDIGDVQGAAFPRHSGDAVRVLLPLPSGALLMGGAFQVFGAKNARA
jgi:hypothetical protein